MLMLSQEDRTRLIQVLETQLPAINPPLRHIFTLMLALLHDHQLIIDMAQGQMQNTEDKRLQ